jgi:hypothetical protein
VVGRVYIRGEFMETWKPAKNWEDLYEVSDQGRVRSKPRKYWKPDPHMKDGGCWQHRKTRILKTPPNSDGYPCTMFSREGKCYPIKVHKLIYESFKGAVSEGHHVDHIDGDRQNNKLDNLQSVTPQDNKIFGLERAQGFKMIRKYLDEHRDGVAMHMSRSYHDGFEDGYNKAIEDLNKICYTTHKEVL